MHILENPVIKLETDVTQAEAALFLALLDHLSNSVTTTLIDLEPENVIEVAFKLLYAHYHKALGQLQNIDEESLANLEKYLCNLKTIRFYEAGSN